MEEKRRCYFCGSGDALQKALWENEYIDVCFQCSQINDVIILKKPTEEQLYNLDKGITIYNSVKQWRKEHGQEPVDKIGGKKAGAKKEGEIEDRNPKLFSSETVSLDMLRERKKAMQAARTTESAPYSLKEKSPKPESINFKSNSLKIGDLKLWNEQIKKKEQNEIEAELEKEEFLQEVRRIKEEEMLEKELSYSPREDLLSEDFLEVPRPIEPLESEQEE